jgi:glutamate racemase
MRALIDLKRWLLILCIAMTIGCAETTDRQPTPWFEKDVVTIVVTDSGLGGISVVAELERQLSSTGSFKAVDIVFANALFSNQGGYNSLTSREEKIRQFNRALQGMAERYRPDIILVACNTLSVLIDDTPFVREQIIPVHSIVDPGVALIEKALRAHPDGHVLLFGTRTTVEENSHRTAIAKAGFDPDRVIAQKCPELAGTIERGFDSEDTELLIATFVDEAVEQLGEPTGPVFASLNCSHYPYSTPLWRSALTEYDLGPVTVLDPNQAMIIAVLEPTTPSRFLTAEITVSVVSKVEIPEPKRNSIGRAVEAVSKATAEALHGYELLPELF